MNDPRLGWTATLTALVVALGGCHRNDRPAAPDAVIGATVHGVAVDVTAAPLPGVTLTAVSLDTGQEVQTTTAADGSYRLFLFPGRTRLSAALTGFKNASQQVALRNQQVFEWRPQLDVGSIAETVEVVALPLNGRNHYALSALSAASPTRDRRPNTEKYRHVDDNEFRDVAASPLSTFSVDVDRASYANVRRFLNDGTLPPIDAVRIEEMVNYFPYDYAPPAKGQPFAAHVEVVPAPWNPTHQLARIGLQARTIERADRPASNLVFLIDVSGSMDEPNKLPLVQQALGLLVDQLDARDRVGIVVYAGAAGMVLAPTSGDQKPTIRNAIDALHAGGSTNGGEGIALAYDLAAQHRVAGGVNRVILATDGDFNVGVSDEGSLVRLVQEKAKAGVFLSVLGFGMGNLQDSMLESLADKGDGNYAYIDTALEARKALVEELTGTLVTVAKDVKIQVEFNPAKVRAYRLIGYENRLLNAEDFNDDRKDAGEVGAGHAVTALYELVPAHAPSPVPGVDPLVYRAAPARSAKTATREMLRLKLRYKAPEGGRSRRLEWPVLDAATPLEAASADLKFAAGVAAFGMLLRESPHAGSATPDMVLDLARQGQGADTHGYRAEFLELVKKAQPELAARGASAERTAAAQ